jgi:hypothetical protein
MHLTRKQIILIVTLAGVAVLITVVLIAILNCGSKSDPIPREPSLPPATDTPAPTDAPTPSFTPQPTVTPSPTPYYLPLVPEGAARTQTPAPTAAPTPTQSPAPEAQASKIRPHPRNGTYNDEIREFMAIGIENGEAIAVLLVHVQPPVAKVTAIPCETLAAVFTLGTDTTVKSVDTAPLMTATARAESAREGCWNLIWAVKNLIGYRAPAYLCVDFRCMDAFFSFAPSLPADGGNVDLTEFRRICQESGEARARSMARFGVGVVRFLGKVSLWDLPAFRSATSGAFTSSLSVFELLSLMRTLKAVDTFQVDVLSTEMKNGVRVLSDAAELPF